MGTDIGVICCAGGGRGHSQGIQVGIGSWKRQGNIFCSENSGGIAAPPTSWFQLTKADLRLLASHTVREEICVLLSHPVCGDLSQQPQGTNPRFSAYSRMLFCLWPHFPGSAVGPQTASENITKFQRQFKGTEVFLSSPFLCLGQRKWGIEDRGEKNESVCVCLRERERERERENMKGNKSTSCCLKKILAGPWLYLTSPSCSGSLIALAFFLLDTHFCISFWDKK